MSPASGISPARLQDLPPKWAHFCLHTENFLHDELGYDLQGRSVVVAFSGGIDSTALLLVLKYLCAKNNAVLTAAHLDHAIRPESGEDAAWAEQFCKDANIRFAKIRRDIPALAREQGVGLEEAGRLARYAFLEETRIAAKADAIFLGHHLDDLCEDMLMRLSRGTGWPGLAGMPGIDNDRHLVRPFLLTPKARLRAFLEALSIQWREDATNADTDCTRNRIRHEILPLFLRENPNFPESVARLWRVGRIDEDYWTTACEIREELIPAETLNKAHKALRLRLYKAGLDRLGPGQALADTLFRLDQAWLEKRTGAMFQFPGEKTARIARKGVVFRHTH